jgi:hypothetical protein
VPSISAHNLGGGGEGSHFPPNGICTYLTGMYLRLIYVYFGRPSNEICRDGLHKVPSIVRIQARKLHLAI